MTLFRQVVTVRECVQAAGEDGVRGVPILGTPTMKWVGFETSPQAVDFSPYGVEQAHGARLYCRLEDRSAFEVGARVERLGDMYSVLARPAPMAGGTLGYAEVLLQRVTEDEE